MPVLCVECREPCFYNRMFTVKKGTYLCTKHHPQMQKRRINHVPFVITLGWDSKRYAAIKYISVRDMKTDVFVRALAKSAKGEPTATASRGSGELLLLGEPGMAFVIKHDRLFLCQGPNAPLWHRAWKHLFSECAWKYRFHAPCAINSSFKTLHEKTVFAHRVP